MKQRSLLTSVGALILALGGTQVCAAQTEISLATYGGATAEGVTASMFGPAAEQLGVTLRQETVGDGLPTLRLQVTSGKPSWDIAVMGSDECASGEKEGLFEKLDFSVVKTDGLPPEAINDTWLGEAYVSTIIAWRTDTYPDASPNGWRDFWDVQKFPGHRAMSKWASDTLPAALMADGVSPDKVHPIDIDRAVASVAKIAPHVDVWYSSGAQAAQLLNDGEVDMAAIWASRIPALLQANAKVGYTYNQGIISMSCVAIVKGSRHVEVAQKLIAAAVSPELQANIPEKWVMYGPTNVKAYKLRQYTPEVLRRTNSSPENFAKQSLLIPGWWAENQAKADEKLRAAVAQ